MTLATFDDVQARFYRELDPEDRQLIETRLGDAERMIRRKVPDLDWRIEEDPLLGETVIQICADAVIRLIQNPEGFVQETDGGYTYMRAQSLAEGRLFITREEWADLGIRKKVSIIHIEPMRGRPRT